MPRPQSSDIPSTRSLWQRGKVRSRRVDGAYIVGRVVAYADHVVPLGSTVTIQRHDNFGMWRIV